MFSGIVETTGVVTGFKLGEQGARLRLKSELFASAENWVALGSSIAISGVCLTIVLHQGNEAEFDIGSETLRKTTLGSLAVGSRVNLERPMRAGGMVHGHFVQGHVDFVTTVTQREEEGETIVFRLHLPQEYRKYMAPKGSVSLDGVSLTIGENTEEGFSIYIIPHTAQITILGEWKVGTKVNVEFDCLARYVVQALENALPR